MLTLTQTFGSLVLAGADYSQILVVVGVVAAVGIGGAIAASRSRKRRSPATPPMLKPEPVSTAEEERRYGKYLARLDELKANGQISEHTYQELKVEFLRKLEKTSQSAR